MTNVQIQYWSYKEGQRHNIAMESENFRHNSATEEQARAELSESRRHNKATEKQQKRQATASLIQAKTQRKVQPKMAHASMIQAKSSMISAKASKSQAKSAAKQAAAAQSQAQSRAREVAVREGELALKREQQTAIIAQIQSQTGVNESTAKKNLAAINQLNAQAEKLLAEKDLTKVETQLKKILRNCKMSDMEMQRFKENYQWIVEAAGKFAGDALKGAGGIGKLISML